jgi:Fe-S oxidoreductase
VLERESYHVLVPRQSLCCGRPLYDYGMLTLAKKWLVNIIGSLRDEIKAGTPVVGLEPSCVSVFRDEMTDLMHGDQDADRMKEQTYMLSEFLMGKVKNYQPPRLERKAVVHGHCHHKSVLDFKSESEMLKKAGLDIDVLQSGCCGMAGAFGYEKDKYDVSIKCGERVLFPAVRNTPEDTFIVADGFSCREQIQQDTKRHALHSAQILQIAIRNGPHGPNALEAEHRYGEVDATAPVPAGVLVGAGALAAGAYLLWNRSRR